MTPSRTGDRREKAPARKAPARKAPARKAPAKKAPAKKAPAKKAPAKKAPAKKARAKEARAKEAPDTTFLRLLDDFTGLLSGELELLGLVPQVAELDSAAARFRAVTQMLEGIPAHKREELFRIGQRKFEESRREHGLPAAISPEEARDPNSEAVRQVLILVLAAASDAYPLVRDAVPLGVLVSDITRAVSTPDRSQILLRSLVTMTVSSFEVLVAGVVEQHFITRKEALAGEDKEFSIQDLKQFTSIEEALTSAIERRVEKLMWRGLDDWSEWFERNLKLKFSDVAPDWAIIHELFERRHTIVHAGGRATKRYLQRVDGQGVSLGDDLSVDEAYVRKVIEDLTVLGVNFATLASTRIKPGDERPSLQAASLVYDLIRQGRWEAVRGISGTLKTMDCPRSIQLVFMLNEWLAMKRLGRFEEIREPLENLDVTGLGVRYLLVRAVLLDDLDEAFRVLPHALTAGADAGGITPPELHLWPILDELRADPRFEAYVPATAGAAGAH